MYNGLQFFAVVHTHWRYDTQVYQELPITANWAFPMALLDQYTLIWNPGRYYGIN